MAADGARIAGTTRDTGKAEALKGQGIEAFLFGENGPLCSPATALSGTTHMLISLPPGDAGDAALLHHEGDIAALSQSCRWIGYLSTTGVYGDAGGDWVDEATPPHPLSDRAKRRLQAEKAWLALGERAGIPVQVFRLAGIYGPGRNTLAQLKAGRARRIVKPGQVFSRIHVDDIARVLLASMARPRAGAIYNVCDDEPAPPEDVVVHAASLLGIEPPPAEAFADAAKTMTPMGLSFYGESKRVRNALIKQELGVQLAYRSYREGLLALLSA